MAFFTLWTENLNEGIEVRAELNPKCPSRALPAVIVMWQKLLTWFALRKTALAKEYSTIQQDFMSGPCKPNSVFQENQEFGLANLHPQKWGMEKIVLEKKVP